MNISIFSWLVNGIKQPITLQEKQFTKWQEAVQKDIEEAFGILKCWFRFAKNKHT